MATKVEGQVAVPTWELDPAHSAVEFSVKHMMMTTVRGRFKEVEATLTANEERPEGCCVEVFDRVLDQELVDLLPELFILLLSLEALLRWSAVEDEVVAALHPDGVEGLGDDALGLFDGLVGELDGEVVFEDTAARGHLDSQLLAQRG